VATWFQIDIDRRVFRKPAGLFERQYFRVPDSIVAVKTLTHDDPILHNDGTYQRVWPHLTVALGRKCQSQIQETKIEITVRFGFRQRPSEQGA
jgi:hypothetical protein